MEILSQKDDMPLVKANFDIILEFKDNFSCYEQSRMEEETISEI